jgi:Protein of unknown function (DUF732)
LVNVRKVTVRGWFGVVAAGLVVSCTGSSTTADDQFMSRLAAAGINGDRATLIADGHAECDFVRHQLATHDMAGIGEGIKLMNKIRGDDGVGDQWPKFAEAAGDIYCPDLKQHNDQNPLGGGESSSSSATAPSPSEPSPSAGATMSRDQIEHFRTRADDAIDEINPAKDTLADALRTGHFDAIHLGCRPVGKAGRDLSAALAETQGYTVPDKLSQLVAQMQQVADALGQTERDCLALDSSSTESDFDKTLTDLHQVADAVNQP